MKQIFKPLLFILPVLGLTTSCAEDGPFEVGKIDINVEVSQVTATTAIVKVTAPESANQLANEISEIRYSLSTEDYYQSHWTNEINESQSTKTSKTYLLNELKPGTTYKIYVNFYTEGEGECCTYLSPVTVTTAPAGDYSALGLKATYTLVDVITEYGSTNAYLNIDIPSTLTSSYSSRILWSESPDMKDSKEASVYFSRATPTYNCILEGVETGKTYYMQVKGSFDYQWSTDCTIPLGDITIGFDNPLSL